MTISSAGASDAPWDRLKPDVPHSARVWNYWLHGKDNFAADREVAEKVREAFPAIVDIARESRAFLLRVVTYLAGEVGIRQFLDVGTGLPTANNTHEVAQRIAPQSRIVYVDNDPMVLVHARALLVGTPEGVTDYIDADVRESEKILEEAARTLDFTQPTALMLLGILGFIPDDDQARSIVKRLMDGLPSGSHLAHLDGYPSSEERIEAVRRYNESAAVPYTLRSRETIIGFFDGLELVDPGVVDVTQWRPELDPSGARPPVDNLGGVARKP